MEAIEIGGTRIDTSQYLKDVGSGDVFEILSIDSERITLERKSDGLEFVFPRDKIARDLVADRMRIDTDPDDR